MKKWDLICEIAIAAIVSAVMVAFRYSGKWVDSGFADILCVLATCDPAISVAGMLVVVWLCRSVVSGFVASIIFCTGSKERAANYGLVIVAAFVVNFLMGIGGVVLGE